MKRPRRYCAACGAEIARGRYCSICKPKAVAVPKRKRVLRQAAQKKFVISRYMPGVFDVMQKKWVSLNMTLEQERSDVLPSDGETND